jgi:hypothetical protein
MGELEAALLELGAAATAWRHAGDGIQEQAALHELETARKRLEEQHVHTREITTYL